VESLQRPTIALLVEDDGPLAAMLERHLTRAAMVVHSVRTQEEAVRRAAEVGPDVILLDLSLAEGSGAGACRALRGRTDTAEVPIIVITANPLLATKAELFRLGADDYLVKPFDADEMILRIGAVLRRRGRTSGLRRIGPLAVSLETGDAWLGATRIELTAAERSVLTELARSWPMLAPRERLLRAPWRSDLLASPNVLEQLVGRLRRKIAAAGGGVEIRAVRRSGYLLRAQSAG
ncbi:MAG: response regulator transcription factor, partial [Chloroflexi bacterium]|nr:response regulator transcription factor [Chloroflexota bacterium]